ncbi:MAG: 4-hydroxy-tetrahydrodipicolinate synthase [Bacteroidetes bacterium]|nr:4-hydroxy-tetrahydrodipicolinate synthase [Bacteroidota bacterium]
MKTHLQGCYTAIVTPFLKDGSIDYQSFAGLLDFQINAGITGIVICGSTGEAATLFDDEQTELIRFTVAHVNKRCLVVGGASSNNTRHAIKRAEIVSALGVDLILSTSPYYNKPSQTGIYEHYKAQSDASGVPIIAYNVPGRTGSNILPDTTLKLQELPKMAGVKEASANVVQVLTILKNRYRPDFYVWLGEDSHTIPMMSCGADGIISVVSNEIPAEMSKLVDLALNQDFKGASALFLKYLDLMEANFWDSNPIPVKYMLSKMGKINEIYRLPLVPANDAVKTRLDSVAKGLGLY